MRHLQATQLRALVRGQTPETSAWPQCRHLVSCVQCHGRLLELFPEAGRAFLREVVRQWRPKADPETVATLVETLPHHLQGLPDEWLEQLDGAAVLAPHLVDGPDGQARLRAENQPAFRTPGLAAVLLARAEDASTPMDRLELAHRASVALEAGLRHEPEPATADLLTSCLLIQAEAYLEQGSLEPMSRVLERSENLAAQGTGSGRVARRLHRAKAELAWQRGEVDQALVAARKAWTVPGQDDVSRGRLAALQRTLVELSLGQPPEEGSPEDVTASAALQAWAALPAESRLRLLEALRPAATLELVDRILVETRGLFRVDARLAEQLARLAWVLAQKLDGEVYPAETRASMVILAQSHVGNALRAQCRYRAAEELLERAWEAARHRKVDDRTQAWVLRFRSSFAMDVHRYREAQEAARLARDAFFRIGQRKNGLLTVITEALALEEAAEPSTAWSLLEEWSQNLTLEALGLAGYFAYRSQRSLVLVRLGKFFEAYRTLPELEDLSSRLGEWNFHSRLLWIRALIHQGLGQSRRAQADLRESLEIFVANGPWMDAALVLLEFAQMYLKEGQQTEAAHFASVAAPIFEECGRTTEAGAAFRLFLSAAQQEKASLQFLLNAREAIERQLLPFRRSS